MAQWEQAGLATQRKVVQVELGAKFVCWWKCEFGSCEIEGKRLGSCNIIFFKHKKMLKKNTKNILWSKTIISRIYCPSFYGHLTIVSMSHDPQKKFFLTRKKNFLTPFFRIFFSIFFFKKS